MKQQTLTNFFTSSSKKKPANPQQINQIPIFRQSNTSTQSQEQLVVKDMDVKYHKTNSQQEILGEQITLSDEKNISKKKRLRKVLDDEDEEENEKLENQENQNLNQVKTENIEQEQDKSSPDRDNKMDPKQFEVDYSFQKNQNKHKKNKDKSNLKQQEIKNSDVKKEEESDIYDEFDDSTPKWARQGFSQDKNRRLHGTPEADPTTLYIPQQDFSKLTKTMQQFWRIKSENFDKIIFFKLGKFYELFYEDALIGNRLLDLNFMGKKMHAGFPEKACNKFSKLLIDLGYKICIVDQTETPNQMEKRISENRKSGKGNADKVVNREVTSVLTIGTVQEEDYLHSGTERYMMVIRKNIISSKKEEYGIILLESQSNQIYLNFIVDEDKNYEQLKTFLLQTKPLEVILDNSNIPVYDDIMKILKSTIISTKISNLPKRNDSWDQRKALSFFKDYTPEPINHYKNQTVVLESLAGLFSYLSQILIQDKVLETATYHLYTQNESKYMVLDSQALYHLEILECQNYNKKKDLSLFGVIDKTVTPGGKRLLKRWLCNPLIDKQMIYDRLDAVEDLMKHRQLRDRFRQSVKQFPDLERLCTRIYQGSVKKNNMAVYYENFSQQRLQKFRELIKAMKVIYQEIEQLMEKKEEFKSSRLQNLLTHQDETGLLPRILESLADFENYITWQNNVPIPIPGILDKYDEKTQEIKDYKEQFNSYLEKVRKQFNDKNINYAHVKHRYELEIPEYLVKHHKPDEFEFTSARKDYKRYITQKLKDMVMDLEQLEEEEKILLNEFVQFVFLNFKNNRKIWDSFVNIFHEIDVLCSLSVWSESDISCRPEILDQQQPYIYIEEGRHPCLVESGINYVPNTINLDQFLLLSGPNMGGKSTLLRMLCILSIMAQIGAYVPCQQMKLTPVDRIFTRIGAQDCLLEGKSTFYVELEETLTPLKYATKNSFFISDELGRGTSTYDGVSIAYAVIKYIVNVIKCRTIFATHFRVLIEEAKLMEGIRNVHMGCYVEEEQENVIFLYKLQDGECPASFGINVAKAVGIKQRIIDKAKQKADSFEKTVGIEKYVNDLAFCDLLRNALK